MAELGVAELRITANPDQALAAIARVRVALERETGDVGGQIFDGIVKTAPAAGAKAGKAVRTALQQTLSEGGGLKLPEIKAPSLEAIKKALDISKDLNATLADLRTYKKLLQDLQASTSATSPEFKRLTATLRETGAAIKAFESGSGNLVEALARVKNTAAGLTPELSKPLGALNTLGSGLKAATSAALETSKALASISAKGAFEAIKLPVFGLPKTTTDVIEKARAQVERLQKQAETGSGKVARLTEGIFALGGAGAAAKGIVDVLGGVGGTAESASAALAEVAQRLNALPSGLKGLGGLGDLFAAGSESINQFTSGVLNAQGELAGLTGPLQGVTDLLAAIGPEAAAVGGVLAFTFAGFQDLIAKSFKPGVDGARQALKGMTDDTQRLLEALARASDATKGFASLRDLQTAQADAAQRAAAAPVGTDDNLQATQELVELNKRLTEEKRRQFDLERQLAREMQIRLQRETREADAMTPARPPEQRLLPAFQERGLNPLDDSVRAGESLRRITEAIGTNWERGARFLEKSNREMARLIEQGLRLQPLAGSPVAQRTNLLPPGAPASSLPNPNQYSRPIGPEESAQKVAARRQAQLEDELADVQAKRLVIQESILQLEKATEAATARAARKAGLLGQSSPISGRLPGDRFIPGSPADLKRRADRRQEAASNALIGGAFPLLFGQGLGASIGGGLGGFAGGLKGGQFGFGLSLLGTAVGAQFDAANQKLQALGAALSDPIGKFGELQQAGVLSSRALEAQVQALINTGREAEAAALIQRDLANSYGDLSSAQQLAATSDELNRSWSQLTLTLASFAVGPLAKTVADTSQGLQGFTEVIKGLGAIIASLPNLPSVLPAPLQLPKPIQERVNQRFGGSLQDGILNILNPLKPVFDTGSALGGLFGSDSKKQQQTNAALEKAKALSAEINRARIAGNSLLAEALQRSEKLAQIEAKRKQDLAGAKTNAERTAINEAAAAEKRDVEEASKAAAEAAKRELSIASQLAGTYGKQRDLIRERVEYEQQRGQFQAVINNPNVSSTDRLTAQRGLDALNINRNDQLDERVRLAKEELEIQSAIVGKNAELRSFITAQIQERRKLNEQLKIQQEARNNFASAVQTAAAVRGNPNSSQQARDTADEAVRQAAKELTAAGADVQAAGKAFFNTVVDAAKQARDNLLNARLSRAQQLANPQEGLNRFLAASTVQDRQFKAGAVLKPELDAALQSIKSNFGTLDVLSAETKNKIKQFYENLNKTVQVGTINGQALYGQATPPDYQFIQDFVSSTKSEQDGKQALSTAISINTEANKALTQGSQLIAENLPGLAKVMADLAGKNWAVSVNVDSQGGVKVAGDANNRALS